MVTLPPPPPASGGVKGVPKVAMSTGLGAPFAPSRSSGSSPKAGIYVAFFLALAATTASLALLVIAGDNMEVAREFLKFLKNPQAQKIFKESNFVIN